MADQKHPQQQPSQLPARSRSAFAGAGHATLRKDGRALGGATTEEYHETFWTPERRKAQSEKAKQLIAEGRFGGAAGFHRRKAKKFQEIAAEHAQARAEEIIKKLDSMIFEQHKDKRLQLEAIREYARYEDWAVKNSREDEKELRKLSGDQLNALLLEHMGEALGIDFEAFMQPVIEGEAEDIEGDSGDDE